MANVADVKTASTSSAANWRWLIGGLIVAGAVGYAAFEWRQELTNRYTMTKHHIESRLDKLKLKLKRQSQEELPSTKSQ